VRFNFEWDPLKAIANEKKHKVSFEHAAEVFLDPFAISVYDGDHSSEEDRWITIGKDSINTTLIVVHTFSQPDADNSKVRLISARKATKTEKEQYEDEQI
jgi:uncharacterized DUF497 family protein